jgi:hypothetical protein
MAALLRAAWNWYQEQEPCTKQHADKRARVRRLLNDECGKPDGERERSGCLFSWRRTSSCTTTSTG